MSGLGWVAVAAIVVLAVYLAWNHHRITARRNRNALFNDSGVAAERSHNASTRRPRPGDTDASRSAATTPDPVPQPTDTRDERRAS